MKYRMPIMVAAALASAGALIAAMAFHLAPRLVWKGLESAPAGFIGSSFAPFAPAILRLSSRRTAFAR